MILLPAALLVLVVLLFLSFKKVRQLEKKLVQDGVKQKEFIDSLPEIVFETDREGNLIYVNERAFELSGYSRLDFERGINVMDLIVPEDRERAQLNITESAKRSVSASNEYSIINKDGSVINAIVHSTPALNNGEYQGLRGIVTDITHLKNTEIKLKKSEDRLNMAQALARVGNWELDLKDNSIWASREVFRLYGLDGASKFHLAVAQQLVHPDDRNKIDAAIKMLVDKEEKYDVEFRLVRHNDGVERIMHSEAVLVKDSYGKPQQVMGVIQDITELKQSEIALQISHEELTALYEELNASQDELRQQYDLLETKNEQIKSSEERFKLSLEGYNGGCWDWQISDDTVFFSDRCMELADFKGTHQEKLLEVFKDLLHPEDVAVTLERLQDHLDGKTSLYSIEHRMRTQEGDYRWIQARGKALWNKNGFPTRMAGSLTDINDMKFHEQMVHQLAYYDHLTGLPNRILLSDRLNMAINLAKKNNTKVAVVFIDLDDFKKINDTMGHFFGDEVLRAVSVKLKSCMSGDSLARLSGDEFTVFTKDFVSNDDIFILLDKLRAVFNKAYSISRQSVHISASMGISVYPDDADNVVDLLKNADTAMFKAKEMGKNRYQLYNSGMKDELLRKMEIESRLRNAITNAEFVLYFQPQISMNTGKIRGFEALIRWFNPEIGLTLPNDFISISEEIGLIIPIGEWVLKTACEKSKEWQELGYPKAIVSVNISAVQLKDRDFVALVRRTLEATGLSPEYLELEITESVLIDSFETVVTVFTELRTLGVKISLDDFGTGYSSLNYLKRLPLNTLKIDKTFIDDISMANSKNQMVGSIITLAHSLNLEIIAEGVEKLEQLEYLKRSRCDNVQGWLISEPLTEQELPEVLYKNYFLQNCWV